MFERIILLHPAECLNFCQNVSEKHQYVSGFFFDIMFHLTICSKQVQSSFNLRWEFTKAIDSLIQTLDSCLDSLTTYNLQSLSYLDSKLYPGFCHAHDVIIKKEYQGCPLMDSPITCTKTRSNSVDLQSDDFLKKNFSKVHSIHM